MTTRVRLAARLLDVVLPGAGAVLGGCAAAGFGAQAAWAGLAAGVPWAVCTLPVLPGAAAAALVAGYAGLQLFLALTPHPGGPLRPRALSAAGAAAGWLLAVGASWSVLAAGYTVETVPDLSEFPLVVPGERVLVRRTGPDAPPEPGDLVFARAGDGRTVFARVAGGPGDRIEVAGRALVVNGSMIDADEVGEVRLDAPTAVPPDESRGLRIYRETLGTRVHPFFYRRDVMVATELHAVPEGAVFLLADNRSTASALDSREAGALPLDAVVGRPVAVLWSARPDGRPWWSRIGARWE